MRNRPALLDPRAFLGQTIDNRYYIEELIGQGGMGYVYRAKDKRSGRACAVKMFLPKKHSELSSETYRIFRVRFKREYNIMHGARHAHIVRVYDQGEYQGAAYFVMEYFAHGSLSDLLEMSGPLPLEQACLYIQQAASALDYIHANGIIHRDIKPQNMLIDRRGQLVLGDFGVAHIFGSDLTLTDQPGTRVYKSPQAKIDLPPDRRDDVYSLGMVLYEILSDQEPHARYIRSMNGPGIPPAIWPVIQKATAEQREQRYATAGEMANDLMQSAHLLDRRARDQANQHRGVRRNLSSLDRSRNSLFFWLRLALLLLVAAGALTFLVQKATAHPSTVTFSFPSPTSVVHAITPSAHGQATTASQASAAVQRYYTAWNQQNYQAAYALLQADYQRQHPFSALLSAYQHTHHTCITITGAQLQADGSVQVQVTDNAVEDAATGGTVVSLYYVTYDVRQEETQWKIAPLSLQRSDAIGTCTP